MLDAKDHPIFSEEQPPLPMPLGINGLGRIGKLLLWHHTARGAFERIVVNVGREVGQGLSDIADYVSRDSTYGPLHRYIYGFRGKRVIEELDETAGTMRINGTPVTVLRKDRNPKDIDWSGNAVSLVVDCTGAFRDPTVPADDTKGSVRGHLKAGVQKVIVSAPFKIKEESKTIPEDAVTTIQGINDAAYDPEKHHIISAASCTTTCLAFLYRILLDHFGVETILGASMVTVHAATSSQEVLDSLPKAGKSDLRKNRAVLDNIILTSTGAAKAAALVIPEMGQIDFVAESVRVPNTTGSIVILMVNLQDNPDHPVTRDRINALYRDAADGHMSPYISYSESQNVSSDIIGTAAAVVVEGKETRVQKGGVKVAVTPSCQIYPEESFAGEGCTVKVPVNQVVVYGWYDNELGSFTHMLGERTTSIAKGLM
ncbi:MAG: glyceraldehyde 3-phosphate dehydrogenase NAD-binding domain-containing protein [Deltaproteobacteria bacterium]|nr:glyceraldehyde 3-phosphate dehydrogenase NAD-binding domain-containing protein [Deltaproteobacteria bacterium]